MNVVYKCNLHELLFVNQNDKIVYYICALDNLHFYGRKNQKIHGV